MRALIQTDHHIRAEGELELHRLFRGELDLPFAALRVEDEAIRVHLAEGFVFADQGVSLKAAGIGDDGVIPAAHAVHPAQGLHHQAAGFLHQVKGVHHQTLHPGLLHILSVDRPDHAVGRVRKVNGIIEPPVRKLDSRTGRFFHYGMRSWIPGISS